MELNSLIMKEKLKVLITGANGFLGSHIAKLAVHEGGWDVRLFVLKGTSERVLHEFVRGGEIFYGDILDYESIAKAVAGVDLVFNTAGSILEWAKPEKPVWDINFYGVRNVCRACFENGVKRLVHTSTAATIGSAPKRDVAREDGMWDLWNTGLYSRSKFLGEKESFEWGARGLDVVVACPHQILGDWDMGPSTPGRLLLNFINTEAPFYFDTYSQFVDVEDVARGHIQMALKGRRGERYILAGMQAVHVKEFLGYIAQITDLRPPMLRLPLMFADVFARPIQWFSDYLATTYPIMTIGNARMLHKNMAVDISKAREELGFEPSDWRRAVRKAVKWFYENGYIQNNRVKLNFNEV